MERIAVGLGGVGTILTTNGYFVSQSDNQFRRRTACDKIGVCGEAEYNLAYVEMAVIFTK